MELILVIMVSGLILLKVLKSFKKSRCCNSEFEFNENVSNPDFSKFLNSK